MTFARRTLAQALIAAAALLPAAAHAQRQPSARPAARPATTRPARPAATRPSPARPAVVDSGRQPVRIPPLYPAYVPPTGPQPVDSSGLYLRLDEALGGGPRGRTTVIMGRALTPEESRALLGRLQPLRTAPAAADSFFFPAQTLAPPRAGRVVAEPFPTRDSVVARPGPTSAAPALDVLRRAPEGEVDLGAEVTITFSQPMVPLGTVGDVAMQAVPARLTPQPPGRWRWIDARTLKFEPTGRLPMATEFTVEIPAGTRSAVGTTLAQPLRWTFATPAARATGGAPQPGPTDLQPILVVAFDQRIDPAAVLRTVRLRAGAADVPVRLATAAEVAADPQAKLLTEGQTPGRWLAFRAVRPLPRNAEVRVSVGPGTPSAEGPRVTGFEQYWEFRTYGPLRIQSKSCPCQPGEPFFINFSNPLDATAFRESMVRVSPAVPGMTASVAGAIVVISGDTRQDTRYTVTFDPAIRDVFGQTLGNAGPQLFEVGPPSASLSGPGGMMVLDPLAERAISISTQGHRRLRLRLARVQPEDWYRFGRVGRGPNGAAATLPGKTVEDRVLEITTPPGEEREVRIDLAPALNGGLGNVVVAVEAMDGHEEYERQQAVYTWVQSTRIGLSAFSDATDLLAWATSLVDGAPIAGAEVRLLLAPTAGNGPAATTDARGLATLALPAGTTDEPLVIARSGGDVAFLARGTGGYASWRRMESTATAAWYAFTDRNLYRPGETVRFKGWVRQIAAGKDGGISLISAAGESVAWTAFDARNNEIARGTAALSALGGFDGVFAVPAGANLGSSRIELRLASNPGRLGQAVSGAYFQVQEFRRPEYTVSVTPQEGPHFIGGSAEVTARASYFAGGALPGAPVRWVVTSSPGSFTPPGWDEWTFGEAMPWIGFARGRGGSGETSHTETLEGATDASGQHVLRIGFTRGEPPRPYTVTAEATVTDVNRQTWSATTALLVHPADIYVGLRTQRAWLQAGDSIDLDLVAVDLDGKPVAGRTIRTTSLRRVWRQEMGQWREVAEDSTTCVRESAPQPVRCVFRAPESGRYEVTSVVQDARGRTSRSSLTVWVSGGRGFAMGPEGNGGTSAELIPDKRSYAVGDTARLLLRTQFNPARGLLTVRRNGLVRSEEIAVTGPLTTLAIPIGEGDVPNVSVQVDLVGAADGRHGEGARGVNFAVATVGLSVPPATRALAVKALPRDTAATPDASTEVAVEVRDAEGRPVPNAEVALVVVDEAVLALTSYSIRNPIDYFYRMRSTGVQDVNLRPLVRVVAPDLAPERGTLVGRVVDARNGGFIGGARVELQGTSIATTTDDAGRFRLAGVAAGTHTLVVTLNGYTTARVSVTVGAEAPAPLRVSLVPQMLEGVVAQMANGRAGGVGVRLRGADAMAYEMAPMAAPPPPPPPPPPVPEGGGAQPQIVVRSNFDPLALFSPVVRTGPDGRAVVPFKLPSNLTRYRVTAVAVEGSARYGLGESGITARQPLMVRPSAPRFLNWGDRFELPVVIQNQTGDPIEVDVAARAAGFRVTDTGRRITIPAHDRVEVRLAAETERAGPAFFQVAAASPSFADAAEGELPVYTPATAEAFATYGTFTGDSAQTLPLQVPGDAIPSFGGLEVSASSTALQELTDALIYLVRYPFECAEQIASRVMGVTALRDVLQAFKAEDLPPPDSLRASVDRDVRTLAALQNPDGGFALWSRGGRTFPYASIHAAHALQRAREKGYTVPPEVLTRSLGYLRAVPRNLPVEYPADVKRALHAYALYVRARMRDPQAEGDLRSFLAATPRDSVTLEMAGWLLTAAASYPALSAERDALLRQVDNRATETASTATFATRYTEGEYLLMHSSRRTDGVVLEALLAARPENPLVPKVVRGLLGHRVKGRWTNTQENAWVLLALDRYFQQFEGQTPEFVARVWLGERFAGSHDFTGRQTDRWQVSVPMRVLQEDRPSSVTVAKEGPGRIYYRAGLRYAPRNLELAPLDAGFAVTRAYEAVDDPRDVRLGEDGRWHVKAGARVRVTLTMTAPSRRVHVALVDPLPAGFEPVNPELQGSQQSPPSTGGGARPLEYGWWWRLYWYEHQNLRDDRAEAFTSLLPAGTYTWSYVARATTPGTFVVPPSRAEEMYSPETFGRGKTERVIVEPADER